MKKKQSKKKIQSPIRVGQAVHICTVTRYYTGRIVKVTKDEILLERAAWIAWPDQQWKDILAIGTITPSEVQPYPDVVSIGRGAVVDVTPWRHTLPGHA